jgi:predicted ATPase
MTNELTLVVHPHSIGQTPQLPDFSRSMDSARFSQFLSQAQEQQANVELANPMTSAAAPTVDAALQGIRSSSSDYLGTVERGLKSLATLDLTDPKSVANAIQQFTVAQVQSVQLSAVLGEISNSKKSLQTLFQNQG